MPFAIDWRALVASTLCSLVSEGRATRSSSYSASSSRMSYSSAAKEEEEGEAGRSRSISWQSEMPTEARKRRPESAETKTFTLHK